MSCAYPTGCASWLGQFCGEGLGAAPLPPLQYDDPTAPVTPPAPADPTRPELVTEREEVVNFDGDTLFPNNVDVISDAGKREIDAGIARFNGRTVVSWTVIGHASTRGTESYNQALSERRAGAVASYVRTRAQGWPAATGVMGMGESQPVRRADGSEDEAASRRVQLTVRSVDRAGQATPDPRPQPDPGEPGTPTPDITI